MQQKPYVLYLKSEEKLAVAESCLTTHSAEARVEGYSLPCFLSPVSVASNWVVFPLWLLFAILAYCV